MTIPSSAIKYGFGITRVNDSGNWALVKNAWVMKADGTWAPIKTAWIRHDDGSWQRILPIPHGAFTTTTTSVDHRYYQNYADPGASMSVTNTGEYDLVINSAAYSSTAGLTPLAINDLQFPVTIAPGKSQTLTFYISGNVLGTTSGTISFTNYIGYGEYANTSVAHTTTVIPDYADITLVGSNPSISTYYLAGTTNSYYGVGGHTFTVPAGVTKLYVTAAGGSGGGGGADSYEGSAGYNGHGVSGPISVTTGDTIGVYVGGGGGAGVSHWGGPTSAGTAGSSPIGYPGGRGGYAGWSSGGGGGGGGATVIKKNGSILAVAAGGGGGGGGGDYGPGVGRTIGYIAGTAGQHGGDKYPTDGGGGGAGGGGYSGGQAGGVPGGDVGGEAGSDGQDYTTSGWRTFTLAAGGGAPYRGGSDGYAYVVQSGLDTGSTITVTIKNNGNGAALTIDSIASANGYFEVFNKPVSVGFGDTATFQLTPYSTNEPGVYNDTIIINSNSTNNPVYRIPVTINILQYNGRAAFSPGTSYWKVPDGVYSINVLAVAGGGGGGGATDAPDGGSGGGGGAGGAASYYKVSVTPGEVLTITVGGGGHGGLMMNNVYAAAGDDTVISGSFGVISVTGGQPGGEAYRIYYIDTSAG